MAQNEGGAELGGFSGGAEKGVCEAEKGAFGGAAKGAFGSVSEARLARLRAAYEQAGACAMLVRGTTNIQWASAFDGVFDEEQAHALFVDGKRAVLHTDSRYVTACERAADACGGAIEVDDAHESHAKFASRLWDGCMSCAARRAEGSDVASETAVSGELEPTSPDADVQTGSAGSCASVDAAAKGSSARLAIEDAIALSEFRKLEEAFAERTQLVETSGLVFGLRAVKDAEEVRRMRAAQAITDAAFSYIIGYMKPGMTEREVQLELEDYMLRHGASGLAFSSIVATGANGASPHAIPGSTRLEAGQCVVMDFGAKAYGYCSDMTRTVFLGAPEGEMLRAWETMRRANEEVEAMLGPDITGKQAHEHAERVLEKGGFGGLMGHGLGHGVGLDIHEEPVLSPRNEAPLKVGNVVTVEPGIYLPGKFGMRLEDFGVITESGFDVFTQSTHEMVML